MAFDAREQLANIPVVAHEADVTAKLHSGALTITGNVEQGQQFCATLFRSY